MQYELETKDKLKCSACGNDEFKQEKMSMGGQDCWCYICQACSNMMSFMAPNKEK